MSSHEPNVIECAHVVAKAGFRNAIESKMYSRDFFQRGRLRVELKNEIGQYIHSSIQNKKQLLRYIANEINKLSEQDQTHLNNEYKKFMDIYTPKVNKQMMNLGNKQKKKKMKIRRR